MPGSSLQILISAFLMLIALPSCLQVTGPADISNDSMLRSGASRMQAYLPMIEGKNVGLVANHSSMTGGVHLADTLMASGIDIIKVFAPEHGFRGMAGAGEALDNGHDPATGIQVISLYGEKKKPSKEDLRDIDILLFDIQDVGVRFYTYISTLTYVMEAAAQSGIPLVVLDRPNPNGFYIDGPVMEPEYVSFVGLHPVPIVYGMTIGEYALMVNGEGWLPGGIQCELSVIRMTGYNRDELYRLQVKPSPNLPGWEAVYLYPSLCLFEGTVVSVGRGTDFPFTVYGHPGLHSGNFVFTPRSMPWAMHPKFEGVQCTGQDLSGYAAEYQNFDKHLNLEWLISAWEELGHDSSFFNPYFEKLAGTASLRHQIMEGKSMEEIRAGWEPGLRNFKTIRKKYLLYDDFKPE